MILGFEDLSIIAALVSPLYYNTFQVWKMRAAHKNCIYCQKSKELFRKEIESI